VLASGPPVTVIFGRSEWPGTAGDLAGRGSAVDLGLSGAFGGCADGGDFTLGMAFGIASCSCVACFSSPASFSSGF